MRVTFEGTRILSGCGNFRRHIVIYVDGILKAGYFVIRFPPSRLSQRDDTCISVLWWTFQNDCNGWNWRNYCYNTSLSFSGSTSEREREREEVTRRWRNSHRREVYSLCRGRLQRGARTRYLLPLYFVFFEKSKYLQNKKILWKLISNIKNQFWKKKRTSLYFVYWSQDRAFAIAIMGWTTKSSEFQSR
jgi:hypothetical protein